MPVGTRLWEFAGDSLKYSSLLFEWRIALEAAVLFGDAETAESLLSKQHYMQTYSQWFDLKKKLRDDNLFSTLPSKESLKWAGFPRRRVRLAPRVKRASKPNRADWAAMLNEVDVWFWQANPSADFCRLWLAQIDEYVTGRTAKLCAIAAVELPEAKAISFATAVARILKGAQEEELRSAWRVVRSGTNQRADTGCALVAVGIVCAVTALLILCG